jgi:hypothetical protein
VTSYRTSLLILISVEMGVGVGESSQHRLGILTNIQITHCVFGLAQWVSPLRVLVAQFSLPFLARRSQVDKIVVRAGSCSRDLDGRKFCTKPSYFNPKYSASTSFFSPDSHNDTPYPQTLARSLAQILTSTRKPSSRKHLPKQRWPLSFSPSWPSPSPQSAT